MMLLCCWIKQKKTKIGTVHYFIKFWSTFYDNLITEPDTCPCKDVSFWVTSSTSTSLLFLFTFPAVVLQIGLIARCRLFTAGSLAIIILLSQTWNQAILLLLTLAMWFLPSRLMGHWLWMPPSAVCVLCSIKTVTWLVHALAQQATVLLLIILVNKPSMFVVVRGEKCSCSCSSLIFMLCVNTVEDLRSELLWMWVWIVDI